MRLTLLFVLMCCMKYADAQLVINEISQGPNGNKEYVELVVLGDVTCPSVCVDLRGWIIDDNNGWYAPGTQTGIATGHLRFPYIPQWSCITPGTIIVIYNNTEINANLPATDETDSNADCVYVLPFNSMLLQKNNSIPTSSNTSYGGPYIAQGNWFRVVMKNGDDSFQTVDPANLTQAYHAISWGNNDSADTIIYFAGSALGRVFYMDNSLDNNPNNWNNWTKGNAPNDETPGMPNNPANAIWINTLNAGCVLSSFADAGPDVYYCGDEDSATTLTASGGASYEWSTLEMTESIDVAPTMTTTYTVTVTSAASCTNLDEVTVFVNPFPNPMIDVAGALCGNNSVTLDAGTDYDYNWSTNETSQSISVSAANTYTVTVTDANNCTASTSTTVSNVNLVPNFMR